MNKIKLFLLFFLILIFIECNKESDDRYFARINDQKITVEEFEKRLTYFTRVTGISDNLQTRQNLLQQMISEYLLIQDYRSQNLDTSAEFLQKAKSIRTQYYLDFYRKKAFFDTISVTQKELNRLFNFYNQSISARHLYAPTKQEAEDLYQRLEQGETFEELAKLTFRDSTLALNGGYLGYFSKGDMDPAFEKVAFSIKVGDISQPVKTRHGYSIIRVEDRFQKPVVSEAAFNSMRPGLIEEIKKEKSLKLAQKFGNSLAQELNIKFENRLIKFIFSEISKEQDAGKSGSNIELIHEANLLENIKNENLVSFKTGSWTVNDFLYFARHTSVRQQRRIQSEKSLEKFITGLIVREELVRRAIQAGVEKEKKLQQEINHAIDGFIVGQMTRLINDTVTVPLEAAKEFYDKDPDYYVFPAEAKIREILVADRKTADFVLEKIKSGESFAELAKKYSLRRWSSKKGGELGFATKEKFGSLAEVVFKLRPGELAGPLEINGYYSIIKMIEKRQQRQKSFQEARAQIEAEMIWKWRKIRLHNYISELRREAEIEIDAEKLRWYVFDKGE